MNYLTRRANGVYYFRMAVPKTARLAYERNEICFSLKTTDRRTAQLHASKHIEHYLVEFSQRAMVEPKRKTAKFYTLKETFERYAKERKLSERMKRDFSTTIDRFIKFLGDKDIRLYAKGDIIRYKDMIFSPK